jgi:hypothetical protein
MTVLFIAEGKKDTGIQRQYANALLVNSTFIQIRTMWYLQGYTSVADQHFFYAGSYPDPNSR